MKSLIRAVTAAVLALAVSVSTVLADEASKKVRQAADVAKEIVELPEQGIPSVLLKNAYGIAVIPGVIKVGFVVGGRYGTGVLMVRSDGGGWSNPVFVSLTGGSVGWQIGAESTDVVLVFKSRRSIDGIMKGKFTLGADAAVAAGPVGRSAEAATDVKLKSEIYSYSRSRGLFAGLSLEGAALQINDDADEAFYGKKEVTPQEIISGAVRTDSPAVRELKDLLISHAAVK